MGSSVCSQVWIMVQCTTTNHVTADKTPQGHFAQRRHYSCLSRMPSTYISNPVLKSCTYLSPMVKSRGRNVGKCDHGQATSEEPCSAPPTPVTPHCGDRNKSGVSNLGTCIYLKRISWRENKRLLSLQSGEEREVHLRLLQMKQQGSEEQETSACVLHSSLLRQVYEGMEGL